eukprot:scaffold67357_cov34-Prasinocladus_malaysianus.AAC.1
MGKPRAKEERRALVRHTLSRRRNRATRCSDYIDSSCRAHSRAPLSRAAGCPAPPPASGHVLICHHSDT